MSVVPVPEIIAKKRDGLELSRDEIDHFVQGTVNGEVQTSQLGALLMAIYMRNMSLTETVSMTRSMMLSGDLLKWPEHWKRLLVDKHSTGGVGDKVSLVLAPALAACGLKVPMISGRGLGYSGGTLDKLESIPGFNVNQSAEQMTNILDTVGCCIVGQTDTLVPADRVMYATRDVTGTVESIPLIAASVISKKAAETVSALVLDVKCGKGAFKTQEKDARQLAETLVAVSNGLGIKTTAVLSNMNNPVGRTVGNALEVAEALECLHGGGPPALMELVKVLGGYLLKSAATDSNANLEEVETVAELKERILQTLKDGSAMDKFSAMLVAQGVAADVASKLCDKDTDVFAILPKAPHTTTLHCQHTGYVHEIDAMDCAYVSHALGAGRFKAGDDVDMAVGLQLHVGLGDNITQGDAWITIHHNSEIPENHKNRLQGALHINSTPVKDTSLIMDIIT